MEKYGLTLKKIRESLNISQHKISLEIMSQSNYSKVENGEIDPPFTKMIELLNRLGMTVDEFLYIHHDHSKDPNKQLSRLNQLKPGDHIQIKENMDELKAIINPTQREQELLAIFEALYSISKDDYKAANEQVTMIWERLKEHDTWYLYDIRLINSIFYLFTIDTAGSIIRLVLKRLEEYKNLGNIGKLSANIQINYVLLLIENKKYSRALKEVEELILFCIDKKLYTHLGACYVRKGILLKCLCNIDPSPWYKRGFNILEVVRNDSLIRELKKEIQFYTNIK